MQLEDGYRRNGVDGEEARENGNEKKYTNNNNNLNQVELNFSSFQQDKVRDRVSFQFFFSECKMRP